jgi:hypothetical protein
MTKAVCAGVAAGVFVIATALACGGSSSTPTSPSPGGGSTGGGSTGGGAPTDSATITIGADGRVSPSTVTITRGGRVTMINNHNQSHDMSSDPHPEHTQCPELNSWGFLTSGQQRTSGNLNTARTCGFHDHNLPDNAGLKGTVIIQ